VKFLQIFLAVSVLLPYVGVILWVIFAERCEEIRKEVNTLGGDRFNLVRHPHGLVVL